MDGMSFNVHRPSHAIWIDQAGRLKLAPGPGRIMHRLVRGRLEFAELTHTICEGCGALHARTSTCVLCGTRLRR